MRARYCTICGKSSADVEFASEKKTRCVECDEVSDVKDRLYQKAYQKARYAATKAILEKHADEYKQLLEDYLDEQRDEHGQIVDPEQVEKIVGRPAHQFVDAD